MHKAHWHLFSFGAEHLVLYFFALPNLQKTIVTTSARALNLVDLVMPDGEASAVCSTKYFVLKGKDLKFAVHLCIVPVLR